MKLSLKHKLIIAAIILGVLIGGIGIFQALGFWKTLVMAISFIGGIATGWYAKFIKDKYFPKTE